MSRTLAFPARASADIEDAHAWYEAQRPGLGSDFERELEIVIHFWDIVGPSELSVSLLCPYVPALYR